MLVRKYFRFAMVSTLVVCEAWQGNQDTQTGRKWKDQDPGVARATEQDKQEEGSVYVC